MTDQNLPSLGVKASKCFDAISVALSYLDAVSSCEFSLCNKKEHKLEQVLFRALSRSLAALRLARLGFYDEALMLARAVGESVNLLVLFMYQPTAIEEWKNGGRWKKAYDVRIAIEKSGKYLPIQQRRYKLLSGMAAHADPAFAPSAHNVSQRPMIAGAFRPEGFLLALNEIALPLIFATVAAARLIELPNNVRRSLINSGKALLNSLGGFDIESQEEYWAKQKQELADYIS